MGNERMPGIDTITAAILEDARRQAEETLSCGGLPAGGRKKKYGGQRWLENL